MEAIQQQTSAPSRILLARILIILSLICALVSTAFLVYTLASPINQTITNTHKVQKPIPLTESDAIAARTTAQQYMNALLHQRYDMMWSMLHPQVQAMWPNATAFAIFWKKRFRDHILQKFAQGTPSVLPNWVNPETMARYNNVEQVPISLHLALKTPPQQQAQLPPEVLNPNPLFQDLPFVIQHVTGPGSKAGRWLVLNGGPADLEAPILPPITSVMKTVQVPIMMYHHISDAPPHDLLTLSLTVTPTIFSRQLDYLKAKGYHTITFNQLFSALYYGGPLPSKPIILTFDDGYEDAYQFAYPILKAHGFSGMFYIISGKVGWQGQMTWNQLREMVANGMQMGSHTIHHVDMGLVLRYSLEQAQQELQVSQATLQQNLHIAIQQFCYPSGEPFKHGTLALRQQIVALLAADGYIGATTDPGMTGITQNSQNPMVLLRTRVDGRETFKNFTDSLPW